MKMNILKFEYNQNIFSALVHEKFSGETKQYRITIMNGELEKLLFGNNILIEKDGKIFPKTPPKHENKELIRQLIYSLNHSLLYSDVA